MAVWLLGLCLGAVYLFNKKMLDVTSLLDEAENQYQVVKKPQMASRAPKSEVYEVTRALSSTATCNFRV